MMLNILKYARRQDPDLSDLVLAEWLWQNGFIKWLPTQYRTYEQICSWMIQRLRNKKHAVKWVYNTMRLQELRDDPPSHISDHGEFMRQFEDELSGKNRYKDVSMQLSNGRPFTKYLDGMIYARKCGIISLMGQYGKNHGAIIAYVCGYSSKP